jgi:hypothetical protein
VGDERQAKTRAKAKIATLVNYVEAELMEEDEEEDDVNAETQNTTICILEQV